MGLCISVHPHTCICTHARTFMRVKKGPIVMWGGTLDCLAKSRMFCRIMYWPTIFIIFSVSPTYIYMYRYGRKFVDTYAAFCIYISMYVYKSYRKHKKQQNAFGIDSDPRTYTRIHAHTCGCSSTSPLFILPHISPHSCRHGYVVFLHTLHFQFQHVHQEKGSGVSI